MIGKNGNICAINVLLELVIQVSALIVQVFTIVCNLLFCVLEMCVYIRLWHVQEKVNWGRPKFLQW
jgi:hypothetical protein